MKMLVLNQILNQSHGDTALSPSTTWLLPEVVPSYGRLNEYYCFNICLSLHDTFVRINCLELDGRLAWWRAALTIFTSYVNWNYYKLHPRCFFWPLWRLQLGGCAGRGHSEAWGGASFVWLCPVPENLICLRSICQTPDTAAQCPPGPPSYHLSHNPSQNGSPANLTKPLLHHRKILSWVSVSGNDDDTGDKFALQADVNDKETLQNLRIHTWSMNIESAYLEVKLRIWT